MKEMQPIEDWFLDSGWPYNTFAEAGSTTYCITFVMGNREYDICYDTVIGQYDIWIAGNAWPEEEYRNVSDVLAWLEDGA